MGPDRVSFSDQIRTKAADLGFDAVGIARANEPLNEDFTRYEAFIRAGMHGEMAWLAEHAEVRERLDGDGIMAGARSVICVARRYGGAHADDGSDRGLTRRIARYARGRDYHLFVRRRLRRLAAFVRSLGDGGGGAERPQARPLCDVHPVLERAWAVRAGLGFVGKNGMLIIPGLGSMVLLGEVVTTLDLSPAGARLEALEARAASRCGSCTRCLDACPTAAFAAPYVLDARRCVSYLTIEHSGAIAPEMREGIGAHLFGCDDCQTACPFNAGQRVAAPSSGADPFQALERWTTLPVDTLLALDEAAWRDRIAGTPLQRAGRAGLARNAAIVLGNAGDRRALPVLRQAAAHHDDGVVREAAAWAIERIERRSET